MPVSLLPPECLEASPTVFSGAGTREELGVRWLRDEYVHSRDRQSQPGGLSGGVQRGKESSMF